MSSFGLRRKSGAVAPEPKGNSLQSTLDGGAPFNGSAAYEAFKTTVEASPEALAKLVQVQRMYMARVKEQALQSVRSFQMLLVSGLTPAEMRSRLITEFTALGVVCALLAGLGFSVMATPPDKLLESSSASIAYCAVTLLSIICNLACVGFSTLMISSVNLLTDEITAWYVGTYAATITNINFQFFNVGFIMLLVALVLFAVYTYPPIVAYVCGGLAAVAAAFVITIYYIVDYARFYKLQDVVRIILGQDAATAVPAVSADTTRGGKSGGRAGTVMGEDEGRADRAPNVDSGAADAGGGRGGGGAAGGVGGGGGRSAAALKQQL